MMSCSRKSFNFTTSSRPKTSILGTTFDIVMQYEKRTPATPKIK
jgi:hypothetical protein